MPEYINKIRTSSGDLQINYEALANLPTISNPNLLINSDFRNPVNQRGQSVYVGSDTKVYTIDRWCMNATDIDRTFEVCDGYIRYKNSNSTYQGFVMQQFERPLDPGKYTITVNVKSVSGNVWVGNLLPDTNAIWGNSTTYLLKNGINVFTFDDECLGLYFQASTNSSVELYWVKLEYGATSTPFVPRSHDEEFMLCLRYFQISRFYKTIWTDMFDSSFVECVPFYVPMRAVPTLNYTIDDTFNVSELIISHNDDIYAYKVVYGLNGSTGHRMSAIVHIDAEIR